MMKNDAKNNKTRFFTDTFLFHNPNKNSLKIKAYHLYNMQIKGREIILPGEPKKDHSKAFKTFFYSGDARGSRVTYPRIICSAESDVFLLKKGFLESRDFLLFEKADPQVLQKLSAYYKELIGSCPCKGVYHDPECILGDLQKYFGF
jgi:hypothetical protein